MNKLYLSTIDRKIGGVCGGLGEYTNLDPILFRLTFMILTFTQFPSALVYLVLWVVMTNNKA